MTRFFLSILALSFVGCAAQQESPPEPIPTAFQVIMPTPTTLPIFAATPAAIPTATGIPATASTASSVPPLPPDTRQDDVSLRQKAAFKLTNRQIDLSAFCLQLCSKIETQNSVAENDDNLAVIEIMVGANSDAMNQVGARNDLVLFAGVLDYCKHALIGKMNNVPFENWQSNLHFARAQSYSFNQPQGSLKQGRDAIIDRALRH